VAANLDSCGIPERIVSANGIKGGGLYHGEVSDSEVGTFVGEICGARGVGRFAE